MVAIITRRVPRYTQSLHRARTVARAPSMASGPSGLPGRLRSLTEDACDGACF